MPTSAVRIGKAKITRITVAKDAQTKIGILQMVIPGQRIFKIVTKKLIPARRDPAPDIWTLHAQ
jgi:hypothetical protein